MTGGTGAFTACNDFVNFVQALAEKVQALEAKNNSLEARITELEAVPRSGSLSPASDLLGMGTWERPDKQQPQQQQQQQQQEQKHAQHVAPAAAPVPQLSAKILPQAPQASVPVVQQQPKVRTGCNALCKMNGVSKSCRFLVHFAATRSFARKPDACQMAYTVVRSRCGDSCSGCMLEATHCT
mmetsp:Transcript_103563/g.200665  ORF Transcript_103563/g.200665 Transcript_103563/m.200665 type:complete len:183 (+) Transcript_103563:45-593(+)